MTHPKNTTAPRRAQQAVTQAVHFCPINPEQDDILQVRQGVDVVDALEDSSSRLAEVLLYIRQHLDDDSGLKTGGVYLLEAQIVSAKAVLDSSVMGLIGARSAGGDL